MAKLVEIKLEKGPQDIRTEEREPLQERRADSGDKGGINWWRKIGNLCIFLLVGLTPLFFLPNTLFPLGTNKTFLATVLLGVGFISYLINCLKTGQIVFPKSLLSLSVLVFLAAAGLSTLFSRSVPSSVYGKLHHPNSFLAFILYAIAFLLTATFLERKNIKKLALVFFSSLFLTTLFGLLEILGKFVFPWPFTRQAGFNTIGSTSSWAVFLAFGLMIIISTLAFGKARRISKILLSALGLLVLAGLIITNYFYIWLILALVVVLFTAYRFIREPKVNSALLIASIFLLFFAFVSRTFTPLFSLPTEIRPSLLTSLNTTGENIILGSGPATFNYSWQLHRPVSLNQTILWPVKFNQGFSFLATLPTTLGILGFAAVLFLIFAFVWEGAKSKRKRLPSFPIVSGIVFLIIAWAFFPSFFTGQLFLFMGLGIMSFFSDAKVKAPLLRKSSFYNLAVLGLIIMLTSASLVFLYSFGQKYAAAAHYRKAITSPNLNQALRESIKAQRLDPSSDQYLRTLSQLLILQTNRLIRQNSSSTSTIPAKIKGRVQNTLAAAIQIARKATRVNPADSQNWENLAGIYENLIGALKNAGDLAVKNYKKAQELDPQNPQEPVNIARVLIASSDFVKKKDKVLWQKKLDEAKQQIEKSLSLKRDYSPAHFLMAAIYMREGKTKEAIGKLKLAEASSPFDYGLAFQLGLIYYNQKDFLKARQEFERAVKINPNYSNARYFLGLIYDRQGKKKAALKEFEAIAKLNPKNKQIKKIISNLKQGKGALENMTSLSKPPAKTLKPPIPEKQSSPVPAAANPVSSSSPSIK